MCPTETERHLQLNKSRYADYNDVCAELVLYLETRLGQRLRIGDSARSHIASGGDAMDLGNFQKAPKAKQRRAKVTARRAPPRATL